MNRRDLQALAKIRLREAQALSRMRLYDGAHYLAGYAVECALKACIARATTRYEFPDKRRVDRSHTHDIEKLVTEARLENQARVDRAADPEFDKNWKTVQLWSETSRHERVAPADAIGLIDAIVDRRRGVLKWLKRYW